MKIHALLTSILLASSSAALADTALKTDNRFEPGFGDFARRRPVWSPLSQMITAKRVDTIKLEDCNDELRALRLQSGNGAVYIYSVTLQLENGARENIPVGQWLYWGMPKLEVDIPHKRTGVERVLVNTWTWWPSTYQVFGQIVDHSPNRPPLPPPPPPLPSTGVTIGKDLTFANSGGYIQLPVGAEKGSFAKLRIEATGSAVAYIGRIYVSFANGEYQTLDVKKPLSRGQAVMLDLTGSQRSIRTVTLMADDDLGSVGHAGARFTVSLL